jgi:hypothetical protein
VSGRLITIHPGQYESCKPVTSTEAYPKAGTPPWEILKRLVGGYIEGVQVRWEGKLRQAYANEDGLGLRLPYNVEASRITDGQYKGVEIVGPLVIWVPDPKKPKTDLSVRNPEAGRGEAVMQDLGYGIPGFWTVDYAISRGWIKSVQPPLRDPSGERIVPITEQVTGDENAVLALPK